MGLVSLCLTVDCLLGGLSIALLQLSYTIFQGLHLYTQSLQHVDIA